MKNLFYLLFVLPLLFSCGGEDEKEVKYEKYIIVSSTRDFENWFIDNYYKKQIKTFTDKYGPNDMVLDDAFYYENIVKITDGGGIKLFYDIKVKYSKETGEIYAINLGDSDDSSNRNW